MKICPKCYALYKDETNVCTECGSSLVAYTSEYYGKKRKKVKKKTPKKKFEMPKLSAEQIKKLVIYVIVIALVIAGLTYFVKEMGKAGVVLIWFIVIVAAGAGIYLIKSIIEEGRHTSYSNYIKKPEGYSPKGSSSSTYVSSASSFAVTRRTGGISIDERNRLFRIDCAAHIFNFSDLLRYEQKSDTIIDTEKHGTLGRTVVGGMLLGEVGAIAGAASAGSTSKVRETNPHIIVYTCVPGFESFRLDCDSFEESQTAVSALEYILKR